MIKIVARCLIVVFLMIQIISCHNKDSVKSLSNTSMSMGVFLNAASLFYLKNNRWPKDITEFPALIKKEMNFDDWGNSLIYKGTNNGQSFTLWSRGPNGKNDNGGNDDITDKMMFIRKTNEEGRYIFTINEQWVENWLR